MDQVVTLIHETYPNIEINDNPEFITYLLSEIIQENFSDSLRAQIPQEEHNAFVYFLINNTILPMLSDSDFEFNIRDFIEQMKCDSHIIITQKDINNKSKYHRVSNDPNEKCKDSECSICISEYLNNEYYRTLNCGHTFHKRCIDKWIKKNNSCPICREKFL